ncbi:MAG: hypothetical protein S4CHLAM45_14140 [Chlamydiales bacterium]|nr:hypothetical protein [Chlamydiales bacterium]MCH9620077.1 hypothetical protein [Chlamydiales bacterium]MCH9623504.1 hypothetical protein [Chlamydiales bacterium]
MAAAMERGPKTERIYYNDTYLGELSTKVIISGQDDNGIYFTPLQTIFHPQGGGQPADEGSAIFGDRIFKVIKLEERDRTIKHYVEGCDNPKDLIGEVKLTIDLAKRALYARLHSAGHLLSDVVHEQFPQLTGYKGNHFPGGQAFVVFHGAEIPPKDTIKEKVSPRLEALIQAAKDVNISDNKGTREMGIDGFDSQPCGGTHVKDLGEIQGIEIRSIKKQKGELKIGYNLVDK